MACPSKTILHASSLSYQGYGVLIVGPSGAGKSQLALKLLAYGAKLVADDQTQVARLGDCAVASCPQPQLQGVIEARGVGLLRAPFVDQAAIKLVIDLSQVETQRLPPYRQFDLVGISLPLVLGMQNAHLAEAILLYLTGGRWG